MQKLIFQEKAEETISINVNSPYDGLGGLLPYKSSATRLKITGILNSMIIIDLKQIFSTKKTDPNKRDYSYTSLDLSEAKVWKELYFCNFDIQESIHRSGENELNECAFQNSKYLEKIILPNNLEKIGDFAFKYCENLQSIRIPESIKSIGYSIFGGCTKLYSCILPDHITDYKALLSECKSISEFNIPKMSISICNSTFWGCESLKSFIVPNQILIIERQAFALCENLQRITISENVKIIYEYVFQECWNLRDIFCKCKIPPRILTDDRAPENNSFYHMSTRECIIHVPKGTLSEYKNSYGWNEFTKIVEFTE
ncbi:MAG: leucine-rich repeat domain-containing protein [Paludibacter sp.]|nr:leucine-rich repeat domain-containing protein [Paludibacter sp.]